MQPQPFVSILTPAYNEEGCLAECIESVLAQTYSNWDYTIVNNCSKDRTLEIARRYAALDPRICVVDNTEFLDPNANANRAAQRMSPEAKYCKFVFADDWLYPSCVEEMVRLAERHPDIGLVGAYGTDGRSILWTGAGGRIHEVDPPQLDHCIPGRDAARSKLLGGPYLFGSMTSLLVRADLIRQRNGLFNERHLHADLELCYDLLQASDFGFVNQVLSFHRSREQSTTSFARDFDSIILGEYVLLLKHGPFFLNPDEFDQRRRLLEDDYYRTLAKNWLRGRARNFWDYHQNTLGAFDQRLDRSRLRRSVLAYLRLHPAEGFANTCKRFGRRIRRFFQGQNLFKRALTGQTG